MSILVQKRILLGVCGGIAAYKSAELLRELRRAGAEVKVMMTQSAQDFITPLTMQALSGHPVYADEKLNSAQQAMEHIALARWADLIVLAPATADCIARLAQGHANDLLSTTCLAANVPIIIAPAMNQQMWHNSLVQANIQRLQQHNFEVITPDSGEQACGEIGLGRLPEPRDLLAIIIAKFTPTTVLASCSCIITAGPTHEPLDPVRYLSSNGSGKMGYALAEAAAQMGAKVTLISGPSTLSPPLSVDFIKVKTAEEMLAAVMQHITSCNLFIGAAAVADYRPANLASHKIKKQNSPLTLSLVPNPDILASVAALANRPLVVGFAAETENLLANAQKKLTDKQLDLIIANTVSSQQGFGVDDNAAIIINKLGEMTELPLMSKKALAKQIMLVISQYITLNDNIKL